VLQLLQAGWKTVQIVSDHGWLLLPGGLPKTELPSALSENTWGRCAVIKSGAATKETTYPWHWNPNQHFALAPGVHCYRAGIEYTHGGISLQECLLLSLTVGQRRVQDRGRQRRDPRGRLERSALPGDRRRRWTGLTAGSAHPRGQSGDQHRAQRAATEAGRHRFGGRPDEDLTGHEATIVILAADDSLVAQQETVVGGGDE
jgi:hypothetical protein